MHPEFEFKAELQIIGINPYVAVPEDYLEELFKQAGRNKSPIPIKGKVNGKAYQQRLVKYSGAWRLYINTNMLKHSPKRIGETMAVTITFDPEERTIEARPEWLKALSKNKEAKAVYDNLTPSLRHEIIRYISNLKTEEAIQKNVQKAIDFLLGKARFIGRDLNI